jgi:LPXTG-motif cell wall-anchored protein
MDEAIPQGPVNLIPVENPPAQGEMTTLLDEEIPLGIAALPKTGELPPEMFYGLGSILTTVGVMIGRKKK